MERTLGTIQTEFGIARLIHDDEKQTLIGRIVGRADEPVGDWRPTSSWRSARKQIIVWYGNTSAYHDSWVLCLRPTRALLISRSESTMTTTGPIIS